MAAYCRVYDSRHLQADYQEPGSAPGTLCLAVEYGLPLPFLIIVATLVKTVPLVQIGMYSSVLVSGNSIDCDVRINLQYEMLRVVCVLLHDL